MKNCAILAVLFVLLNCSSTRTTHRVTYDSMAKASKHCCPSNKELCCLRSLVDRVPLNCQFSLDLTKAITGCLETALFNASALNHTLVVCCGVYSKNDHDCQNKCIRKFAAPSVAPRSKVRFERTCHHHNNRCFKKCLREMKMKRTDFNRDSSCILPNIVYIGPEI